MRALATVAVALAACVPAAAGTAPLPAPPPGALADTEPRLPAGEQTAWNVFYQGVQIGRADLVVDDRLARTTFRTSRAARLFAAARLELATALERGHVRGVRELLTQGGATERSEATVDGASYTPAGGAELRVPGGTRLHTAHSALGVLRAWSAGRAPAPGYLWLWSGGQLYRLDVARPVREDVLGIRALRVDGTVRAPHLAGPVTVAVWLAANADRTPVRLTLRSGSHVVAAEVYESTASLQAR
ncbi:MAG TPA: hypothetical protein VNO30_12595 [Kofleriaceae bacterium]|nr:hypothetical protein [Kofleriaceae bacterium]